MIEYDIINNILSINERKFWSMLCQNNSNFKLSNNTTEFLKKFVEASKKNVETYLDLKGIYELETRKKALEQLYFEECKNISILNEYFKSCFETNDEEKFSESLDKIVNVYLRLNYIVNIMEKD